MATLLHHQQQRLCCASQNCSHAHAKARDSGSKPESGARPALVGESLDAGWCSTLRAGWRIRPDTSMPSEVLGAAAEAGHRVPDFTGVGLHQTDPGHFHAAELDGNATHLRQQLRLAGAAHDGLVALAQRGVQPLGVGQALLQPLAHPGMAHRTAQGIMVELALDQVSLARQVRARPSAECFSSLLLRTTIGAPGTAALQRLHRGQPTGVGQGQVEQDDIGRCLLRSGDALGQGLRPNRPRCITTGAQTSLAQIGLDQAKVARIVLDHQDPQRFIGTFGHEEPSVGAGESMLGGSVKLKVQPRSAPSDSAQMRPL